jgi:deoxyribonuclease V
MEKRSEVTSACPARGGTMSLSFGIPDLERELRALLAQIPAGKVATCGRLSQALGSPLAAKWVGYFALHHRHDDACRCHRIVRAGGKLGGYATGKMSDKIRLLKREGVLISAETIDLARFGFENFEGDFPLVKLRSIQEELAAKVSIRPRKRVPKMIGGVDVAYPSPDEAQAAYALVETETGRLVWSHVVRRPVRFPYITSFLSFRELPILLDLLAEVRQAGKMAEVLLVDGSGILHPRRAGAASHLGVTAEIPTIGVTKKLLCGQVDIEAMQPLESRPVLLLESQNPRRAADDGRTSRTTDRLAVVSHSENRFNLSGVAIRPTSGSLRPIFVSPGHRVDLSFAEEIVRRLLLGRRLPEPLYWADRLSKIKGGSEKQEQPKN